MMGSPMHTPTTFVLSSLIVASLAAPSGAQIYRQTFDGPKLPSDWTVQSGTWSIQGGRAVQSVATTSYMTLQNFSLLNCVVEADVYWGGTSVQLGGVAARHGGTSTESCVMGKVQSNGSTVQGFDTLWSYERPGGVVARTGITPLMSKTRVRLLVVGNQGWLQCDSTQDGIFDIQLGAKTYSTHNAAGLVGINGYNGNSTCAVDNFALYNAVLMPTGSSIPKIGTTFKMTLTTQATSVTPFICALSLSNGGTKNGQFGGIPVGGGRYVPLGVDPLLDASIALAGSLGLAGVTDSTGVGAPSLQIPNLTSLVGLGVYCAGVTSGFVNISNDHYIKFVQ